MSSGPSNSRADSANGSAVPGRRALVLIQDGLGDRPVGELQGQTPLEAASTPVMDALARAGKAGTMAILGKDGRTGTDVGHLAWFGQSFREGPCPRGPVEAAGVGVQLQPGEVALRFNFCTLGPNGRIIDRRGGRIREGTARLAAALDGIDRIDSVRLRFFPATEHRGVLVLRGPGLSHEVGDSDPGGGGTEVRVIRPTAHKPEAIRTAAVLNRLGEEARRILADHPVNLERVRQGLLPANGILTRAAGNRFLFRDMPSETALSIGAVSGESTVIGVARLSGIEVMTDPRFTANLDTDLEAKADLTLDSIQRNDLTFLHLKGCDIAGHSGDARAKKDFIERTDRILGQILDSTRNDGISLVVGLVADHSTPCSLREHSEDHFPVVLARGTIEPDEVESYGEEACRRGSLVGVECEDYLGLLLEQLGRIPPRPAAS